MSNVSCRFNNKSFKFFLPTPDKNYFISPWVELIFADSASRVDLMSLLDLFNTDQYHYKLFSELENYKLAIFCDRAAELVSLIKILRKFVLNSERRKLKKALKKLQQLDTNTSKASNIIVKIKQLLNKRITLLNVKSKIVILNE